MTNEYIRITFGIAAWIALCVGACFAVYAACVTGGKEADDGK